MSLDNVLIISFCGIMLGIILLLFSNDEKLVKFCKSSTNKILKGKSILADNYKLRIGGMLDENTYDLRFYAQVIDIVLIVMLLIISNYYVDESYSLWIEFIAVLIFLLPLILWKQSIGQKFMHLKVYRWDNKPVTNVSIILIRYVIKYLIFPISIFTFIRNKLLVQDIIFKTYEK